MVRASGETECASTSGEHLATERDKLFSERGHRLGKDDLWNCRRGVPRLDKLVVHNSRRHWIEDRGSTLTALFSFKHLQVLHPETRSHFPPKIPTFPFVSIPRFTSILRFQHLQLPTCTRHFIDFPRFCFHILVLKVYLYNFCVYRLCSTSLQIATFTGCVSLPFSRFFLCQRSYFILTLFQFHR